MPLSSTEGAIRYFPFPFDFTFSFNSSGAFNMVATYSQRSINSQSPIVSPTPKVFSRVIPNVSATTLRELALDTFFAVIRQYWKGMVNGCCDQRNFTLLLCCKRTDSILCLSCSSTATGNILDRKS